MARMYFHGTSAENAAKIIKHGFKPGTYFARDLSNSLAFGGDHVFWVLFEENPFEHADDDAWQVVIRDSVPPSMIVYLRIYSVQTTYYNAEVSRRLRTLVLRQEYGPAADLCSNCDGAGELGHDDHAGEFVPQVPGECTVCPTCDGDGSLAAKQSRERSKSRLRAKKEPWKPETILKRVQDGIKTRGLHKCQVGWVRWWEDTDSDGDPGFFFRIGVRPKRGVKKLSLEELKIIVAVTKAVMKRAKLIDKHGYVQLEDLGDEGK